MDNSENGNEEQDPVNNDSQPKQKQNELSEIAKSVRDKVTALLAKEYLGGLANSTTNSNSYRNSKNNIEPSIVVPIVASVSGGCDSVALFHALVEWNEHLQRHRQQPLQQEQPLQLDITVVHFHHRQRPFEADEDYRLVRELVDSHNKNKSNNNNTIMSFRLEDWKDRKTVDPKQSSTDGEEEDSFSQNTARMWRRNALRECAKERLWFLIRKRQQHNKRNVPFGIVLTAHHDDDLYETVLFKLLRGVHLLNLHDRAIIASIARMEEGNGHRKVEEEQEEEPASPIYMVRPFVTDSKTLPNTIMAGHAKEELVRYLTDRGLEWREDASNHDPNSKYLRNRVRNELIPLLRDLTDDSFKNKRIPDLLEQSRELSEDLEERVKGELSACTNSTGDREVAFWVGDWTGNQREDMRNRNRRDGIYYDNTPLVRSQALYRWMSMCVAQEIVPGITGGTFTISYESLKRVVKQLDRYPSHEFWTIELGSGWEVERAGHSLRMRNYVVGDYGKHFQREGINSGSNYRAWEWSRVLDDEHGSDIESSRTEDENNTTTNSLRIQVTPAVLEQLLRSSSSRDSSTSLEFVSTTLRDVEADKKENPLKFCPAWRNSPIKLRAVLRGQKVPAHLRDDAQLLFLIESTTAKTKTKTKTETETAAETTSGVAEEREEEEDSALHRRIIVALRVREKWLVDKEFHAKRNDGNNASEGVVTLKLERRHE